MKSAQLAVMAALVLALLAPAREAAAHPVGVSQGEYLCTSDRVLAGLTFARRELASELPWLRSNGDGFVAFEEHRDQLGSWLVERMGVSTGGEPCAGTFDGMRFDGDGVALALSFSCRHPLDCEKLVLDLRFVADLSREHRHLVGFTSGDSRREAMATTNTTKVMFDDPPRFVSFVRMGIEHIATGYDHLLFLLGLVLVGGPLRSLAAAITAFTFSHSITLALAALDVWSPSPRVVEPCIALSIAYVGIENWFVTDARGRWRITLPFGLVHGFGFAGALREAGIARTSVPTALLGFNVGVEIGQLAVLAALVPLVLLARKQRIWESVGMRACTAIVALLGIIWFVARAQSPV